MNRRQFVKHGALAGVTAGTSASAQRAPDPPRKPIQVVVRFHLDDPAIRTPEEPGPTRSSLRIKRLTELLEKLGVKAEYAFVGGVVQQLADDFPGTIEKIKALKLPIAYHPGAGHTEPCPVGRGSPPPPGAPREVVWEGLWNFETRTLTPDWRFDETGKLVRGNPRAQQPITPVDLPLYRLPAQQSWLFGGWLAIQNTLGVTPLQTDAGGHGPLYEALGAGYPISEGEVVLPWMRPRPGPPARTDGIRIPFELPELHEVHLFPGVRPTAPKYYRKAPGVDAPRTVDPAEWFEILARNLPGGKNFVSGFLCHVGADWERLERVMSFLAARPESFRIASFDPESDQWRPENAPLAFYRRTYGVGSLAEVRSMNAPLKRIHALSEKSAGVPGPGLWGAPPPQVATGPAAKIVRPQSLTADQILEAADYLLGRWPQGTHDGDLGAPPALLQTSRGALSLADAFEALTASLVEQRKRGRLPTSVRLRGLRGPVDFPVFDLKADPKLDPEKAKTGYMPHEIPRESMPEDPDVVNAQGLPPCGDFHVWMPTHTKVEADDMMAAVERVSGQLTGHVPGVISVRMLTEDSRGREPRWLEMKVNPAEFLYALAQEYRAIHVWGKPGPVVMVSMKVAGSQRCQLIIPYTADTSRGAAVGAVRFEGFIWRAKMSVEELDRAWTTGAAGTRR